MRPNYTRKMTAGRSRWHMSDESWHMTDDMWQVTGDMWNLISDIWHVTEDSWHWRGESWQVTDNIIDKWHMNFNRWQLTGHLWVMTFGNGRLWMTNDIWMLLHDVLTDDIWLMKCDSYNDWWQEIYDIGQVTFDKCHFTDNMLKRHLTDDI